MPQPDDYPVMRYDDRGQFIGGACSRRSRLPPPAESEAMRRFRASMGMDYEKWHDGIGYDLAALAALDSETARSALRRAGQDGPLTVRLAVAHRVPELLDDAEKTACIVEALRTAVWSDGLRKAIDLSEVFHPPEVITALWKGLERRTGDVAVHFAALLYYLHGLTSSPFDMAQRPLFLRFNTVDAGARLAAIADLPVDPARMRYTDFQAIDAAWIAHHFEWRRSSDGRDRLTERSGFEPLPPRGHFLENAAQYDVPQAVAPQHEDLGEFLARRFHGRRLPPEPGASDGVLRYEVEEEVVFATGAGFFIAMTARTYWPGQPGDPQRQKALIRRIGEAFDAELAQGRHATLFISATN